MLSYKPCLRRRGEWARRGSGLDGLTEEVLPLYQGVPPWQQQQEDAIRFGLDLPSQTKNSRAS